MNKFKLRLPVLLGAMAAIAAPLAQAELLEYSFNTPDGAERTLSPSTVYANPTGNIKFALSAGIDRKVKISIVRPDGSVVNSATSHLLGGTDRITVNGKSYYGAELELAAPGEGEYSFKAEILTSVGDSVQTDTYPISIDTTAPTLGELGAVSYGGVTNDLTPPDVWYTGLYSTNKYYVDNVEDTGSGILEVKAISTTDNGVYRYEKATWDAQGKQAHIGNGSNWFPHGDNGETLFGLQFEAIDKAGNVARSNVKPLYYDTVGATGLELIAVYDPDSSEQMIGRTGWVQYEPGMTVKTNPVQWMYRLPKTNYSDYARGGAYYVGASEVVHDGEYVYGIYVRPYRFLDGNHVRISDRRQWIVSGVGYNLVLSDSAPEQPVRKANYYQYSDIGWSSWGRHVKLAKCQ